MTVLEFTNSIDGTINDFRDGVINDREFRSAIMDTLIEVAKPKLTDSTPASLDFDLLSKYFVPASKGKGEFYTVGMLILLLGPLSGGYNLIHVDEIKKALAKLNAKENRYRAAYETFAKTGYWLKLIKDI